MLPKRCEDETSETKPLWECGKLHVCKDPQGCSSTALLRHCLFLQTTSAAIQLGQSLCLCGMKYKDFQECCGDGNVHVWEIIGRSSQTRVTRTACIDNKGHNSHDTAPRRILEECSVYGMTTGSIPHSATTQKTCQWKILRSRARKFAATDCAFPFSHYHSRKKYESFQQWQTGSLNMRGFYMRRQKALSPILISVCLSLMVWILLH